jgi:hypothetical protein
MGGDNPEMKSDGRNTKGLRNRTIPENRIEFQERVPEKKPVHLDSSLESGNM